MPIRRLLVAAFALAFSGALAAQDISIPVYETELPNGMKVLLVERHETPRISCRMFFRVGSVNERPGLTGVSHLLEHMMFKGTNRIGVKDAARDEELRRRIDVVGIALDQEELKGDRADPKRISDLRIDMAALQKEERDLIIKDELWETYLKNGATGLNAFTSNDVTAYIVNIPSNRLELYCWLESDRIANQCFREFYSERDVVMEERRLGENTPTGPFFEAMESLTYDAHPYSWPVVGWMSDLLHLPRAEMMRYYDTYYAPNNAILVLVGDFRKDEAMALIVRYLAGIPRGAQEPPPVVTVEPPQVGEKRLVSEADSEAQVILRYHTPAIGHPDLAALDVIDGIMSGRAGRLNKTLVRRDEVAVSARGSSDTAKYPSVFTFSGTPKKPHTPEEVEAALDREIERLKTEPVTAEELAGVKKRLRAGFVRSLRSIDGLSTTLGYTEANYRWREILDSQKAQLAVTAEDIQRAATQYFLKTNRVVGILRTREPVDETKFPPKWTIRVATLSSSHEDMREARRLKELLSASGFADARMRSVDGDIVVETGVFDTADAPAAKAALEKVNAVREGDGKSQKRAFEDVEMVKYRP
ncbi:MAG: insulinase family protein [Planctomycetes bacterium]|nr:insulinase family protein [Planctomycetota bacterium]